MNSIIFADAGLFALAVTALEIDATPVYELDNDVLTIYSNDIDGIMDVLHGNGIYHFDVERDVSDEERNMHDDRDYNDDMDGDFDSGMASAGHGTDEDYGHFGDE